MFKRGKNNSERGNGRFPCHHYGRCQGDGKALDALNISLSVVVFLGAIMLAGIVVNNAIVLVDYINTLRRRGLARDEAIVTAGTVRLRPILMTTVTTILALMPNISPLARAAR